VSLHFPSKIKIVISGEAGFVHDWHLENHFEIFGKAPGRHRRCPGKPFAKAMDVSMSQIAKFIRHPKSEFQSQCIWISNFKRQHIRVPRFPSSHETRRLL